MKTSLLAFLLLGLATTARSIDGDATRAEQSRASFRGHADFALQNPRSGWKHKA